MKKEKKESWRFNQIIIKKALYQKIYFSVTLERKGEKINFWLNYIFLLPRKKSIDGLSTQCKY